MSPSVFVFQKHLGRQWFEVLREAPLPKLSPVLIVIPLPNVVLITLSEHIALSAPRSQSYNKKIKYYKPITLNDV